MLFIIPDFHLVPAQQGLVVSAVTFGALFGALMGGTFSEATVGEAYTRRIRAMGIRDHPTAPRSPWQTGHVERLIGSIRRECLDHIVVFGEAELRRVLKNYASYYNRVRTHLALNKNSPLFRRRQTVGNIVLSILGGLHHLSVRV